MGPGIERGALDALVRSLRGLADDDVRVGARVIEADDERALLPMERRFVAAARPVRRHEFASGRVLLRSLIGRPLPIPVGPDRRPLLPSGIVASIAHDRAIVIAAVSTEPTVAAVGVDVEPLAEIGPALGEIILRDDDPPLDALVGFVLKEAAFKAWSALGGRMLDHHDVRLEVSDDEFRATVEPDGRTLSGRYTTGADRVMALVIAREPADVPC